METEQRCPVITMPDSLQLMSFDRATWFAVLYSRLLHIPQNIVACSLSIAVSAYGKSREASATVMGPTALDTLNPLPNSQIMQSGAEYLVSFEWCTCSMVACAYVHQD